MLQFNLEHVKMYFGGLFEIFKVSEYIKFFWPVGKTKKSDNLQVKDGHKDA